ncbi:MAG TPA: pantetheine-phosphate adenylyltransferase [Armatimonadota bacterium]|jgi:pantetheine-phosphate adenylyltransferase
MATKRIAIYPGSFDPITNGHLDVVERASRLFDEVVVAVASNSQKAGFFTPEERVSLLKQTLDGLANVRVSSFQGLTVAFAREMGATALIRGLRAVSDFEYEFQMALMNRRLDSDIETVLVMTDGEKAFLSSSVVKEVARLGGDVSGLVPEAVYTAMRNKLGS